MNSEDVKKWLALLETLLETLLVILPEGEWKDKVIAVEKLLESETLKSAIDVNLKLYDEVKALVVK